MSVNEFVMKCARLKALLETDGMCAAAEVTWLNNPRSPGWPAKIFRASSPRLLHSRTTWQWILVLAILGCALASAGTNDVSINAAALGTRGVTRPSTSYIVTLRREADQDGCARAFNIQRHHVFRHALNGFAANLDVAAVEQLRHDSRVLAVEPDGEIVPCAQTVPTGILRLGIANFPVAHINGMDDRINVDVAVMDTGIQTNHPDLNVVQWVDCTGDGNDGNDWNGHGTHVAGTIGALDNDFGVVGVAPGTRLWSVQVIGPTNHTWTAFIAGCDFISGHADKISVVNASLTGHPDAAGPYTAIHQAVSNLVSQGIVFVVASGNNANDIGGPDHIYGTADDILPAALSEVMAVSAMNPTNDLMVDFSNFSRFSKLPDFVNSPGAGIDLAAPGVNIFSTWTNSSYAFEDGTSMSAAHAAGLVALYIAANGRGRSLQDTFAIRQAIIDHSQPQSQWLVTDSDPDGNMEPLAFPSEVWVPAPTITGESLTPQGFQISFTAVPGYTYTAQSTDMLASTNQWTDLTSTNGEGRAVTATLTDPAAADASCYRLKRQPTP